MMAATAAPSLLVTAAFAVGGLAFGVVYFAALRRTADLYAVGQRRLVPAALTLGRLAAAILFLGFAARTGALPLLAGFLGFLVARGLALRTVQRTA
jgi:N-ATPase, AtpR subunit